jgi:hypothetical protein
MVLVRYAVAVTHPTIGTLFACMSLTPRSNKNTTTPESSPEKLAY